MKRIVGVGLVSCGVLLLAVGFSFSDKTEQATAADAAKVTYGCCAGKAVTAGEAAVSGTVCSVTPAAEGSACPYQKAKACVSGASGAECAKACCTGAPKATQKCSGGSCTKAKAAKSCPLKTAKASGSSCCSSGGSK